MAVGTQQGVTQNFQMLSRYHLENYFLDAEILCQCFAEREEEGSWLRSAKQIEQRLREIARSELGYVVSLVVSKKIRDETGHVNAMPKGCHEMDCSALADAFFKENRD